jgi:hypothetical protein
MLRIILAALLFAGPAFGQSARPPVRVGTTAGTVAGGNDPRIPTGNAGAANGAAVLDANGNASALTVLATGGTTARMGAERAADRVNVKDFGALGNALLINGGWTGTDDTAAISAAYIYAVANNRPLYFPGSAGAYLTATGNPLAHIGGPLIIVGDGMDVSRIIWKLDETQGSLGPIVSGGNGYTAGDILTVQGGTFATAMQIKVLGVASGVVTQATAWGQPAYTVLPTGTASVTGGTGFGATFTVLAGDAAIGSNYRNDAATRLTGLTIEGISVIGNGAQNPAQSSCGKMAIHIYSFNEINIRNIGVDYSRCMSVVLRNSAVANINGNRVRWSARDMINSSASWQMIANNRLEHGGDDAIATPAFAAETNALSVREGVVVANNYLTDVQGIVSLGSNTVSITGNVLVRPKLRGIVVSTGSGGEGATPTRAVTVTGNTITDLITVTGDPISSGITSCIKIGTTSAVAGTAPGIPGFTVAGTGEVIQPFPYMRTVTTTSTVPMPPGSDITITGNNCTRTLDASANGAGSPIQFSSMGFGQIYSSTGPRDFSLLHSSVSEGYGVNFESGILRNVRVTGNTFSGVSDAVHIASGVVLQDADLRGNTFRDITSYGVNFVSPVSAGQRVSLDNNLFDGDPNFYSSSRTVTGTAADGSSTYSGLWTGSYPIWLFQSPASITLRNNQIRNFALPWQTNGQPVSITGASNKVFGTYSPTSAWSIGVGGMAGITDPAFDIVPSDENPTSDIYGQALGTTINRGLGSIPGTVTATTVAPSGGVNSIAIGGGGQYTFWPNCSIAAPATGRTAKCHIGSFGLSSATLINGGKNYAVGNFPVPFSGSCSTVPAVQVTSVDANGAITGISGSAAGACQVPAFGTTPAQGGAGSGASIKILWYVQSATVDDPGTGYSVSSPPALAIQFGAINAYGTTTATNNLTLGTFGATGGAVILAGAAIDGSGIRQTLTSTYTVPANTSLVRLVQTGTLAASTITLPTALADGQSIQIVNYAGTIAALTFSPVVSGWTNASAVAAYQGIRVRWDATSAAWIREQ